MNTQKLKEGFILPRGAIKRAAAALYHDLCPAYPIEVLVLALALIKK